MCDVAAAWAVSNLDWRTARKRHQCYACNEYIEVGQRYHYTFGVQSGSCHDIDEWRHCARCRVMYEAIQEHVERDIAVDPGLDCGTSWEDAIGDMPEYIEALAFLLPGETVPYA